MEVLYIFILSEPFVGIYNRKKKKWKNDKQETKYYKHNTIYYIRRQWLKIKCVDKRSH